MTGKEVMENDKCGKCNKLVPDDKAMYCEGLCKRWFDLSCAQLSYEDYNSINKVSSKVIWYCQPCKRNISDIISTKSTPNDNDWTSVLNVVLSGIQDNSAVTHGLAERIQCLEDHEKETKLQMAQLTHEIESLRDTLDRSKSLAQPPKENDRTQDGPSDNSDRTSTNEVQHNFAQTNQDFPPLGNNTAHPLGNRRSNNFSINQRPRKHNEQRQQRTQVYNNTNFRNGRVDRNINQIHESDTNGCGLDKVSNENSRRSASWKKNNPAIVGSCESSDLGLVAGERKAYLYLGRVKKDCTVESVSEFVRNSFPGVDAKIEQLASKSENYTSFKICVDFNKKDELMKDSAWPKNVILKRFLFRRPQTRLTS